ncbi:MAG: site-2 protease family protein [bacterium]|nr:site-2 protease family protein [bacterium]
MWGFASDPINTFLFFGALLIAITVHEFAHAWVADRKGDPTARLQGRLTLNPLAHLDPMGTLFLILVGFGWGKPVPVDEFNLRNPKTDMALVALAGPAANIISAIVAAGLLHVLPMSLAGGYVQLFLAFITLSLVLAFFNLIPLYPLDGSRILGAVLPDEIWHEVEYFLKEYSLILLILILLPLFGGRSLASAILQPLINVSMKILIG